MCLISESSGDGDDRDQHKRNHGHFRGREHRPRIPRDSGKSAQISHDGNVQDGDSIDQRELQENRERR
jgi:hypothetical protein